MLKKIPRKCTVWHIQLDSCEENDWCFWRRGSRSHCWRTYQALKLLGLSFLSSVSPLPVRGLWGETRREGDPSISNDRSAPACPAPPPASHCFYLISQACCHGTEDGTSTLVLNDLLDDSLLVRHSCHCSVEMRDTWEGSGGREGVLIWTFYSELKCGVMGYLPNELPQTAVIPPLLPPFLAFVIRAGHLEKANYHSFSVPFCFPALL